MTVHLALMAMTYSWGILEFDFGEFDWPEKIWSQFCFGYFFLLLSIIKDNSRNHTTAIIMHLEYARSATKSPSHRQRNWGSQKLGNKLKLIHYQLGDCVFFRFPSPHFFFSFISISWRLITLQYCSGFCHTLTWVSHGFTCVPHPDPPSHLPLHPIPLGLPSAPALSTCLMHPTWAGDLFHSW